MYSLALAPGRPSASTVRSAVAIGSAPAPALAELRGQYGGGRRRGCGAAVTHDDGESHKSPLSLCHIEHPASAFVSSATRQLAPTAGRPYCRGSDRHPPPR